MKHRHYLLLVCLLLAAHLSGCVASQRQREVRRYYRTHVFRPPADSVQLPTRPPVAPTPDSPALPEAVRPPAPALVPRFLDAVGLSTPEGRARRQARRDVAASVPRHLGKGAVYAVNSDVVNAFKPRAAVIRADSGATVTAIGKNKAPAATAAGATATQTTIKPPTPWLKYGLLLAGIGAGYWLLFGGGGVLLLAFLRRRNNTPPAA